MLVELLVAALRLLYLLLKFSPSSKSPLLAALFHRVVGRQSKPLILLIARYVKYDHHVHLPLNALKLLHKVASATVDSSKRPPSLLAYFGREAEDIRDAIIHRVNLHGIPEAAAIRVAVFRLMSSTLQYQPGFMNLLLNLPGQSADKLSHSALVAILGTTEALTFLDSLKHAEADYDDDASVLCAALEMLRTVWDAAPDHHLIVNRVLQADVKFWSLLVALVRGPCLTCQIAKEVSADKAKAKAQVQIKAHCLAIIALEIFFVKVGADLGRLKEQIPNGATVAKSFSAALDHSDLVRPTSALLKG